MKQVFYSEITKKYYDTQEECEQDEARLDGATAKREKALKEFNEAKTALVNAIEVYNKASENLREADAELKGVNTVTFEELLNKLFGLPLTK